MKHRTPSNNTAFLDFLFLTLMGIMVLYMLAIPHVNPKGEKTAHLPKAEFLIEMSWPGEFSDDIDLYVQDPQNNLVFFSRRDQGLMHLDRDDLGHTNDIVYLDSGEIKYGQNVEVVAVRGILPGEYVVNAHVYRHDGYEDDYPIPITITLIKINKYKKVITVQRILDTYGQEETFFTFKIDNKGVVTSTRNNVDISLIKRHNSQIIDIGED